MREPLICLGCGLEVGGCQCPPPSTCASSRDPYRTAADAPACPRCNGRLAEEAIGDVSVLDCGACGGFFIDRSTIAKLTAPDGHALRISFPKRLREVDEVVRYLVCPQCGSRMNRTVFARASGVVVDVCKADGIWFDVGEVNAIVDFVEAGGMDRARAKEHAHRDDPTRRTRDASFADSDGKPSESRPREFHRSCAVGQSDDSTSYDGNMIDID